MSPKKRPTIVGEFLRERRESAGLSQKALGGVLDPPVSTQFVSNLERGVTPVPVAQIPSIARALGVGEGELLEVVKRQYALKLSAKLGGNPEAAMALLLVEREHFDLMKSIYRAYRDMDEQARRDFVDACRKALEPV